MVNKIFNYKFITNLGLLLTFVFIFYKLFIIDYQNHPYILGDWLISYYDGGFNRRGLSGVFVFFLQDILKIELQMIVFIIQISFYTLFFTFLFLIIKEKIISKEVFLFIWSPLTLLFYINDSTSLGRKEVLVFFLFSFYVYLMLKNKESYFYEILIIVCLFIFTLFHELVVFFIPYFLIARKYVGTSKPFNKAFFLSIIFSYVILIFVILLYGMEINRGNSINILEKRGVYLTGGIFNWDIDVPKFIIENITDYVKYLIIFAYGLVLFLISSRKKNIMRLNVSILYCFVFSLPLFYIGLDWGRWLNIHFILSMIIILALAENQSNFNQNRIILSDIKKKDLIIAILNLIITMKHYLYGIEFDGLLIKILKKFLKYIII